MRDAVKKKDQSIRIVNQRVKVLKEAIAKKNHAIDTLKNRAEDLKEALIKKQETVENLNERITLLNEKLEQTRNTFYKNHISGKDQEALEHNTEDGMDAYFAKKIAPDRYDKFSEKICEVIAVNNLDFNNLDVADFGCGPGLVARNYLKDKSPKTFLGLDFSAKAVEIAHTYLPDYEFLRHDLTVPLDKKFHLILCTEVLEHLPTPGIVIQNISHSLRDQGKALITIPNGRLDRSSKHLNFWTKENLKDNILKEKNLEILESGFFSVAHENSHIYALLMKE